MPSPLAEVVSSVARRLSSAGHEAWLVGGSVRDLALGREPHDADLATNAHPEEIERLFEHTVGVGKAFGTILVVEGGCEVQATTYRSERGYSDARRPDEVRFGTSLEEDALRRDFTCNALFLDPLTDELRDPTGGFGDLEAGLVRCVGEPEERFREDGLRLLRLARFAAAYDLEVEPATLGAARASVDSLRGVSSERIHAELARMSELESAGRALGLLDETGVLARCLPGIPLDLDAACRVRGADGPAPGPVRLFAALLAGADVEAARAVHAALRPPGAEQRALADALELLPRVARLGRAWPDAARSERILLARATGFADALAVQRARAPGEREGLASLEASLSGEELYPAQLVTSELLSECGIAPGRRFGELLAAGEAAQLDQEITDEDTARAWLRARLAEGG